MQNDIITVLGQKGYGKTTFLKKILIPEYERVIILDTMHEYHDLPGSVVSESGIETVEIMEMFSENEKGQYIIVQQSNFSEYNKILDVITDFRDITLVIDEVDKFAEPNSIHPSLKELYNTARHYEIDLIAASRRPNQVNRIITSQTDLFIIFHTHEPNDLVYYKNFISRQVIEPVKSLGRFEYHWYGDIELSKKFNLEEKRKLE